MDQQEAVQVVIRFQICIFDTLNTAGECYEAFTALL